MIIPQSFHSREDLDTLLFLMVKQQASDLHIGGDEPIKMRIHGEIKEISQRPMRSSDIEQILLLAYDENQAAVARVRSGIELDFSYQCLNRYEDNIRRFRVNADLRQRYGRSDIKLVFRSISPKPPTVEELGIPSDIIEMARTITRGLVIVAGATGSGKSTLLASLLRHRLENTVEHLVTLEAPIEYVYDDITSASTVTAMEVSRIMGHNTFYQGLVSTLRKDPDLILVGEARDKETILAAISGTQTGHALFTTVHTNGVNNTMQRLLKVFDHNEREAILLDIVDALSMIVYQTLVPKVGGGRVAIREYLIFDKNMKALLGKQSPDAFTGTINELLYNQGTPLLKDAENKRKDGVIDEETFEKIAIEAKRQSSYVVPNL